MVRSVRAVVCVLALLFVVVVPATPNDQNHIPDTGTAVALSYDDIVARLHAGCVRGNRQGNCAGWGQGANLRVLEPEDAFSYVFTNRVSPVVFFTEHWERAPLHVRARSDEEKIRFSTLFNETSVGQLLDQARAHPQRASLHFVRQDAAALPRCRMDVFDNPEVLPLGPELLTAAHKDGYSLVGNNLSRLGVPAVAALDTLLVQGMAACIGTDVYWTPANARAFCTHWDLADVIVLQVHGRKVWRLRPPVTPLTIDTDHKLHYCQAHTMLPHQVGAVAETVVLEAGDVLYLPRGWVHEGATVGTGDSGDGTSLHLSIGVESTMFTYAYLLDLAVHLMERHPSFHLPPALHRPQALEYRRSHKSAPRPCAPVAGGTEEPSHPPTPDHTLTFSWYDFLRLSVWNSHSPATCTSDELVEDLEKRPVQLTMRERVPLAPLSRPFLHGRLSPFRREFMEAAGHSGRDNGEDQEDKEDKEEAYRHVLAMQCMELLEIFGSQATSPHILQLRAFSDLRKRTRGPMDLQRVPELIGNDLGSLYKLHAEHGPTDDDELRCVAPGAAGSGDGTVACRQVMEGIFADLEPRRHELCRSAAARYNEASEQLLSGWVKDNYSLYHP